MLVKFVVVLAEKEKYLDKHITKTGLDYVCNANYWTFGRLCLVPVETFLNIFSNLDQWD